MGKEESWNTGRKGPCLQPEFVKCAARVFLVSWTELHSGAQHHPCLAARDCCTRLGDSSSSQGGRSLLAEGLDLVVPPDCSHCPAGTEPVVGFEYKWWNTLPTNMETTVLSGINFEYKGMTGKGPPTPTASSQLPAHPQWPF